jgi:hypothetical protein
MMLIVSSLVFMWIVFYLSHSEPKLEPSKVDRFFMRHSEPSEPSMMTLEAGTAVSTSSRQAVTIPTTTPIHKHSEL